MLAEQLAAVGGVDGEKHQRGNTEQQKQPGGEFDLMGGFHGQRFPDYSMKADSTKSTSSTAMALVITVWVVASATPSLVGFALQPK